MTYKTSNGLEIEVIVKRKNNKNIYFRVKEDLKLYVTCPIYISSKNILKLIEENEASIIKMYDKVCLKNKDSEFFLYLGKKYYIKIDKDKESIEFTDNIVITPSLKLLDEFYQSEVRRIFEAEVAIAKKCFHNLPEFTVKYQKMSTRWGVCSPSKKWIKLNTELLKKDVSLLDYVIIHELCHFFEGNHSKRFWHLVSLAYPNYKEARKALKE